MICRISMCLLLATSVDASWVESKVGTMKVLSNTGGSSTYDKVVILLHGGGSSAEEIKGYYDAGNFGVTTNIKYVAPESTHSGNVWFVSTKASGCGHSDACSYDTATIATSADQIKAVIDNEKTLKSWTNSDKIFLGGYSQGAQMASQVQLAKMTEKLGGVMVFCGAPLPPIANFPTKTTAEAQAAATYFGTDMRWMFMFGETDPIFEGEASKAIYTNLLTKLGAAATIKINHIEVGWGHEVTSNGWANMVKFINGANTYDSSTEVA